MEDPIPSSKLRELKGRAQLLQPALKIGKAGLTPEFIASLNLCLERSALVKIKFDEFKDQKKILVPRMATETNSRVVLFVGNTATFYRPGFNSSL